MRKRVKFTRLKMFQTSKWDAINSNVFIPIISKTVNITIIITTEYLNIKMLR